MVIKKEKKMVERLNWENTFKKKFHSSWHSLIRPIIEGKEVYDIYQELKRQKSLGLIITPASENTFRSFQIDLNSLKIVLIAQSPYPQVDRNGHKSNGIALDCEQYGGLSPSLSKFYEAVESDVYDGLCLECNRELLSLQWLIDQGMMFTNASLTCLKDSPDAHRELWKPFWKLVFEKIFFPRTGLIFMLLGSGAAELEEYTNPVGHHVLKCEHPVRSVYEKRKFNHNNIFSKANELLEGMNGKEFKIEYNYSQILPF